MQHLRALKESRLRFVSSAHLPFLLLNDTILQNFLSAKSAPQPMTVRLTLSVTIWDIAVSAMVETHGFHHLSSPSITSIQSGKQKIREMYFGSLEPK